MDNYLDNYRFSNCTHTTEPGCAVHAALEQGALSSKRWTSYRKLVMETSYQDDKDTYLVEKEKRFKNIAKMNKQAKKKKL